MTSLPIRGAAGLVAAFALVLPAAASMPTAQAAPVQSSQSQRAALPKYQVTLKVNTTQAVRKETEIKLRGKVKKGRKGQIVRLQVKYPYTKWKTKKGYTRLNKDGKFVFKDIADSRNDREYRVLKPGDSRRAAGVSPEVHVDVYYWQGIYDFGAHENAKLDWFKINGEEGSGVRVTTAGQPGFGEMPLARKCLELSGTFGLADSVSQAGSTGSVTASTDGTQVYTRAFGLGETEVKTFNVKDVFTFRLDFAQVSGTPAGAAMNNILGLCD